MKWEPITDRILAVNACFLNDIYLIDHLRRTGKDVNLAKSPQKYPVVFIDINLSFIAKMI